MKVRQPMAALSPSQALPNRLLQTAPLLEQAGVAEALFDHAPIDTVVANLDGHFLEVNPALWRILEIPAAEPAAGLRWENLVEPGQPARNLSWILAGIAPTDTPPVLQTDARFRTRAGQLIDVQWNLCLAPGAEGRPAFQLGRWPVSRGAKRPSAS